MCVCVCQRKRDGEEAQSLGGVPSWWALVVSFLSLVRCMHLFSRAPSLSLCQHLYGALNILGSIQSLLRHSSTVSQQQRYSSGLVCALQLGFPTSESFNYLHMLRQYVSTLRYYEGQWDIMLPSYHIMRCMRMGWHLNTTVPQCSHYSGTELYWYCA